MIIHCCGCEKFVEPRLTDGSEIYTHRADLHSLPYWKCDACQNYVGCHHKTKDRTRPLGNIPTPKLRAARRSLHELIDSAWRSGLISRKDLYKAISNGLGREYHTGDIKSISEIEEVKAVFNNITEGIKE